MTSHRTKKNTTDRTVREGVKAEIAASIAESLTQLARMAREQKLTQLHGLLDTAIKQAEYDATSERKSSSRRRRVA